jgi:hypothetical protein
LDALRDLLYAASLRKLAVEWGSAAEAGLTGIVKEIGEASAIGDSLDSDAPARRPFSTFAAFLRSQESPADAGYWEARALAHRFAGERSEEERALLRGLPSWFLRSAGWRRERRVALLERLLELVQRRVGEDRAPPEPMGADWPQANDPGELWKRRAIAIAVWLCHALTTSGPVSAARAAAAWATARELLVSLSEEDGSPGVTRWGRSTGSAAPR